MKKNREIKFRALEQLPSIIKGLCPSEWVYGTGVFEDPENTWLHSHDDTKAMAFGMSKSVVKPETVGQFTGLQDKNGKDIYEGDIVDYIGGKAWVVSYCNGDNSFLGMSVGYYVQRDDFESWVELSKQDDWEVIGNIYENPELMSDE